jgi:polysaccharide export outer membrane protein
MTARFRSKTIASLVTASALLTVCAGAAAQQPPAAVAPAGTAAGSRAAAKPPAAPPAVVPPPGVAVPPDYVIGPEDVLSVVYWREKDMTTDVNVRPDGKISLPLLNDIPAAGLSPDQLRDRLTEASKQFFEDPSITVVVKQMNSRKVFITGEVAKPGPYALFGPTTVLQLLSMAGGLRDYANAKKMLVLRTENGRAVTYPFNYKDVVAGKNLQQNIELKPGDTIVVP